MQYLRDNIYITAPLPLDGKYMKASLQGATPYTSILDVNNEIPYDYRHIGLTVCIYDIGLKEYWYKEGTEDNNLVLKLDILGSGAVKNNMYNENPSGILDGINTVFTTVFPFVANTTRVYLNGQRQRIGETFDYTESSSTTITFINSPHPKDSIIIDYEY